MLRPFSELKRFAVTGRYDEGVGHLRDLYLSRDGLIRYLVVDTNMAGFINRQIVLFPPTAIRAIPLDGTTIETDLILERLVNTPALRDAGTGGIPSAEHIRQIDAHYGWSPDLAQTAAGRTDLVRIGGLLDEPVFGRGGAVGWLRDLLVDLSTFRLSALVVDIGSWLHSRPVVLKEFGLAPDGERDRLVVDYDLATVRAAPPFDRYAPAFEQRAPLISRGNGAALGPV